MMAEEFTIAPMRRLIKKFGDIRISEDAGEAMRQVMGDVGLKIAKNAVDHAISDDRRTVLERDIRIAYKEVMKTDEVAR